MQVKQTIIYLDMTNTRQSEILQLLKCEVVPAIGCTEPIAVALAAAKCSEILEKKPERIELFLSGNIIKNAMGVGIPGTDGMVGLPIAIALGTLIGKSEYQLEVLKNINPAAVKQGIRFIEEDKIHINLKDTDEKLYIEVRTFNGKDHATVIITGQHTHFSFIQKNGSILLKEESTSQDSKDLDSHLSVKEIFQFSTEYPSKELAFILESKELNNTISKEALNSPLGHALGNTLAHYSGGKLFGDSTHLHILMRTAAACDARMSGSCKAVMSNSGSGNQGISVTMPVVVYAEDNKCTEEQLIRALTMSHLMAIYIKQSLGRLSALCGCVVASTGASCGITYLMGGKLPQVENAVKYMVANITGMICDGAKPSCALKVASGSSTALLSAVFAMNHQEVFAKEGIIDNDVDTTIHNMTKIGKIAMNETDEMILNIMVNKE